MTATILRGTFAQVIAELYAANIRRPHGPLIGGLIQAPRGITVKQWINMSKGDK